MATRRRHRAIDVWPGYVDVLAALLMLVIFVLMLFSLAQFLLSQILDAQENELGVMYERVVQLTDLLGLEQEKTAGLSRDIADLTTRAEDLEQARATLTSDLAEMTERDAAKGQQLQQQLLLVASLQEDVDALRALRSRLEAEVGILASALDRNVSDLGAERDRSKGLEARLADQAERTLLAQRELEQRDIRIQALSALVDERERAIEAERRLTADAQAEVALLNQKLDHLRDQLAEIKQLAFVS